jgi:DNA repair protein RadA/Sms
MAQNKQRFACSSCGSFSSKWMGQCPDCLEWGTISQEVISSSVVRVSRGAVQNIQSLEDDVELTMRTKTPIEELNRVLGGGLVCGSVILIGGDPGIGKSTLLLQLSSSLSQNNMGCLYITGEESANQIKLRGKRLGIKESKTGLLSATNIEDIISTIDRYKKDLDLVVIDSIQTVATGDIASASGTVSQIRACANMLINYAKQNNITLLIACHVNKDGNLAGPKVLEHMVDTVLYFEGDNNNHFRILRSIKNRFGGVNEIGVFEMTSKGLVEISNPSQLFLMDRENNVSGSAVFAGIEGSRPLLVEIQALIAPTNMATPRRSVVGWDNNRLSMIIAVLSVRFGLNLTTHEVYLSVAGGLRITEPAADLAVAAALISAASNTPLPQKSIFFGEVGLSGEVRKVSQTEARIKEASKLGFEEIYCNTKEQFAGLKQIMHLRQLKSLI